MKKKYKKYIRLLIFVIVIIYAVFNSDLSNELKANIKQVTKETSIIEKADVNNELEISFIDVGQADSILIRQDDKNMLIDAGNNEDGKKLVSYFKSLGITSFEYVVATHAHEDHIGGMDDILNNFNVRNFYMPDVLTTTKTFEDVLDALKNKNLMYTVLKEDETFKLGDVVFNTLYIGSEDNDLNDTSIVLKLDYEDISFLFTGDATKKVENEILDKDIKSDVLKIGHHGSSYSSSDSFLKKVSPSYAVIEVGENNSYNHPHEEVLTRLNKHDVKIYRTDKNGTIIFTTDGKNISIKTMKTDTNG